MRHFTHCDEMADEKKFSGNGDKSSLVSSKESLKCLIPRVKHMNNLCITHIKINLKCTTEFSDQRDEYIELISFRLPGRNLS